MSYNPCCQAMAVANYYQQMASIVANNVYLANPYVSQNMMTYSPQMYTTPSVIYPITFSNNNTGKCCCCR